VQSDRAVKSTCGMYKKSESPKCHDRQHFMPLHGIRLRNEDYDEATENVELRKSRKWLQFSRRFPRKNLNNQKAVKCNQL